MIRLFHILGIVAALALLSSAVLFGATACQVDQATRPEREVGDAADLEMLMLEVREVDFLASDGVVVAGWLVRGRQDRPAIVMGHELGASKKSLAGLARSLMQEGYSLLLVDFRGHGRSGGGRSTLGVHEKRELLAAIEFLRAQDVGSGAVGLYGVGMGAHAAVLAAAEAKRVTVLVLDGLYPDVVYALTETLYADWTFGRERLGFLPTSVFEMFSHADAANERASDVLAHMLGRDMLLLASEQDPRLGDEMIRMYRAFPQQMDVDGNLVLLPATQVDGLYGDAMTAYHERVTGFLQSRLR